MTERTFSIIKPDAVKRHLIGAIFTALSRWCDWCAFKFFHRVFDRQKLRHHHDDSKRFSGQYVAWISNRITAFQR